MRFILNYLNRFSISSSEIVCFSVFVIYQEIIWLIFIFFGVSGLIFITFLLETNRAPFDLAEAESELVTGYSVEYGGFYFALYYLGEYFHLFFFSMVISIVLFGGWELPNFLYLFLLNKREENALNQAMTDDSIRLIDSASGVSGSVK